MSKDRMYITLNRDREWRRCLLANLCVKDNRIVFTEKTKNERGMLATGTLITGSIDSCEYDHQWDAIRIEAELPENSVIKVSCHASDSFEEFLEDRVIHLDEYIASVQDNPAEALEVLSRFFTPAFSNAYEGLARVKGRYLWVRIDFLVPEPEKFCLSKIKLLLAEEKLISYLPEIYRDKRDDNDFFERFIGIFDSIFFDLEDSVNRIGEKLDYTIADSEILRYLASWLCINDARGMEDDELRRRIAGIMQEYEAIGTKPGLEAFVERELGVKPRIIEYFNYKEMLYESQDREIFEELFGTNPYKFFVLLPEEVFSKRSNINSFLKKLKANIPAHTEAEVILLRKGTVLGKHTYLGVNSMVGEYNYASMDENIAISYDTLIGGNSDEK